MRKDVRYKRSADTDGGIGHSSSHEDGGSDEISIEGLSGTPVVNHDDLTGFVTKEHFPIDVQAAAPTPQQAGHLWYDTDSVGANVIFTTTRIINTDSPYTVLSTDHVIFADTDAGAITINLPAGIDGREYKIINCGSNDVTLTPNGAELLNGSNASMAFGAGVIVVTYETTEGWW